MSGWVGLWAGGWTGTVAAEIAPEPPVELATIFDSNQIAEMLVLLEDADQQPRSVRLMFTPIAVESRLIRKRGRQ